MLTGSFYTGLSGLQANAVALNVIGNNLSNVNTAGYKRSGANFGQIMSNTVKGISGAGNPNQIGLGVKTTEVVAKFQQGSIQTTGIKTQLALQGEGFFMIKKDGTNSFTRAGNFGFNEQGYIVSANGGRVQGFLGTNAEGLVDTSTGITDLRIDLGQASAPRATDLVRFVTNVSAEAVEGDEYASSIEVFDGKGVSHQLTLTLTKNATEGGWDYEFELPDGEPNLTIGLQPTGELTFGADGKLLQLDGTPITTASNRTIQFDDLNTGAGSLNFTWSLFDDSDERGTPPDSFITSFGSTNNTGTLFQTGYGSGVLQDVDFAQDGTMIGFYNNGQTLELGRVAIATFNNKLGLKQVDGGNYLATAASGPASVDGEGTGGRGSILSSSLEGSNVDIAEEFTSLIIHQRGYQSNSKTITTVDSLLQEALSLKR